MSRCSVQQEIFVRSEEEREKKQKERASARNL